MRFFNRNIDIDRPSCKIVRNIFFLSMCGAALTSIIMILVKIGQEEGAREDAAAEYPECFNGDIFTGQGNPNCTNVQTEINEMMNAILRKSFTILAVVFGAIICTFFTAMLYLLRCTPVIDDERTSLLVNEQWPSPGI